MISRRVARFERFILTPLSFVTPIAAIAYFFTRAWWVGAYLILAWHCIGLIGQSIHKDRSFDELVEGKLTSEENIRPDKDDHQGSQELAGPLMQTSWLIGLSSIVLLLHHGKGWGFSVPVGISVAILMGMIFTILFSQKVK